MASPRWSADGVIERPSDIDVFSFAGGAGTVTVTVNPAARAPNLDLLVELRDGAGALLASGNPVDALPATLTATVASSGTYYVTVQGVGKGDPLTTGYTDYGSLGLYAVTVSAPTAASSRRWRRPRRTPSSGTVPLAVNFSSSRLVRPRRHDRRPTSGPSATARPWQRALRQPHLQRGRELRRPVEGHRQQWPECDQERDDHRQPAVVLVDMRVADIAMSLSGNTRTARAVADVTVARRRAASRSPGPPSPAPGPAW